MLATDGCRIAAEDRKIKIRASSAASGKGLARLLCRYLACSGRRREDFTAHPIKMPASSAASWKACPPDVEHRRFANARRRLQFLPQIIDTTMIAHITPRRP
jgi:hypothetical protein